MVFCKSLRTDPAIRVLRRLGVAGLTTLILALPATAQAPFDDAAAPIQRGLAAFEGLRQTLGLPLSRLAEAELSDNVAAIVEEGRKRAAGVAGEALLAALCEVAATGDGTDGSACLAGLGFEEIGRRLEAGQAALSEAAGTAAEFYEKAYRALVAETFDTAVCRSGATGPCEDVEAARRWWNDFGLEAFMVLDRIGREQIKLSARTEDADLENARAFVHSRLVEILRRPEMERVVRALALIDGGRFGALATTANRTAALAAAADISSFIQDEVSRRLERDVADAVEAVRSGGGTIPPALRRIATALAETKDERPAVDLLLGAFETDRQRIVQIVALGNAFAESGRCRVPDLGRIFARITAERDHEPEIGKVTVEGIELSALAAALRGIETFARKCSSLPEGSSAVETLEAAFSAAEGSAPTAIEVAQALCGFWPAVGSDALLAAFRDSLPVELAPFLDGDGAICGALARLAPRRPLDEADFQAFVDALADEAAKAALVEARSALGAMGEDAHEKLRAALDDLSDEFWAIGRLLADEAFARLPAGRFGGDCASADGPRLFWTLGPPALRRDAGALTLELAATFALCRRAVLRSATSDAEERPGISLSPMAKARGVIAVDVSGLAPAGGEVDVEAAREALHRRFEAATARFSFTLDPASLEDVETIADALVQILPSDRLAGLLDASGIASRVTPDGRGIEIRAPFALGEIEESVCVVVPVGAARPALDEACSLLETLGEDLWHRIEERLTSAFVARMATAAAPALERLAGIRVDAEAIADAMRKGFAAGNEGVTFFLSKDRAVLEIAMPAGLDALGLDLPPPLDADDVSGGFRIVGDPRTLDFRVVATPQVDVLALARRVFAPVSPPPFLFSALAGSTESPCAAAEGPAVPPLSVAFGPALPIEGAIGTLCWDGSGFQLHPPAGGEADLRIPAAGIRLRVSGSVEADGGNAREVRAEIEALAAEDPWGFRFDTVEMLLVVDLATGEVTIPEAAPENADLYDHIRTRAQAVLPRGVTVTRIEISSQGIDLVVNGLGQAAAEALRAGLGHFFAPETVAELREVLPDVTLPEGSCEALRTAAFGAMLREMRVPDPAVGEALAAAGCEAIALDDREEKLNAILAGGERPLVTWSCERAASGDGLRRCDVTVTALEGFCRLGPIRFVPGEDGRGGLDLRRNTRAALETCVSRIVAPLVPPEMRDLRSRLSSIEDLAMPGGARLECGEDLGSIGECRVVLTADLDFEEAFEPVEERLADLAGELSPEARACVLEDVGRSIRAELELGFDGGLRLTNAIDDEVGRLVEVLRRPVECLIEQGAAAMVAEAVPWLATFTSEVAQRIGQGGQYAGFRCHVRLSGTASEPACDDYTADRMGPEFLTEVPSAIVFTRTLTLFSERIDIEVGQPIVVDGGPYPAPSVRVACLGCADRLDGLADRLARAIAGSSDRITYETGASIGVAGDEVRLSVPLVIDVGFPDRRIPVAISCTAAIREGGFSCDGGIPDPALILGMALEAELGEMIGGGYDVPMGIFEARIDGVDFDEDNRAVLLSGVVAFEGLAERVRLDVRLPLFGHTLAVSYDRDLLTSALMDPFVGQINALFGAPVSIEITRIDIIDPDGTPVGIEISSRASIEDLFTISVPNVQLTKDGGLRVVGPKELSLEFPPGLQIPVPPVAICPTGGALGPDRLVIFASVTAGECTADTLLSIRGRAEVALKEPGRFMISGDMLLLRFLALANATGVVDLREKYLDSRLDIGGPLSQIIRYQSDMQVEGGGDNPHARTKDELQLFSVPVQEQEVYVDFKSGEVSAEMSLDLFGILEGSGRFGMEGFGRNPHAEGSLRGRILGLTLSNFDLRARLDYARGRFEVLGLGLTVVVPGLDALTPSVLIDMIENLLTPDFKNLDKALEALLNGNVTINPLGKFGPGGEAALDGEEGDSKESQQADAPGDTDGPPSEVPGADDLRQTSGEPSTPSTPSALNPEGRHHVEIERDGERFRIRVMEGQKEEGVIASVQPHGLTLPILERDDPATSRVGRPLAFSSEAYAHFLKAEVASTADGCGSGLQPMVFTFADYASVPLDDQPLPSPAVKVGYFELCRLRNEAGVPMAGDAELEMHPHRRLLLPFLTALAVQPAGRPALADVGEAAARPEGTPARVLLSGRFATTLQGTPMMLGLTSPGRLLVVGELPRASNDDEAVDCTATPSAAKLEAPALRIFAIDAPHISSPLTEEDVRVLQPAITALAGCPVGSAALSERGGETYLASAGYLSSRDGGDFVLIRRPDPDEPPIALPPDPMIRTVLDAVGGSASGEEGPPPPSKDEIRTVADAPPPEGSPPEALPVLDGSPGGSWYAFGEDEGGCVFLRGGEGAARLSGFDRSLFGGCKPARRVVVAAGPAPSSGRAVHTFFLELSEGEAANADLLHIGADAGSRFTLGAVWGSPRLNAVLSAAERADLGNMRLLAVEGVDALAGDAAAPLLLVFGPSDAEPTLAVWAAEVGSGAIALPEGLARDRISDLPRLLSRLDTDDALPPPAEYRRLRPLTRDGERMVIETGVVAGGEVLTTPLPVVSWSTEPGLNPGWQLSARMVARPPDAADANAATTQLLDETLATPEAATVTYDVWLFDLGEVSRGVALRHTGQPEFIRWWAHSDEEAARLEAWQTPSEEQVSHVRSYPAVAYSYDFCDIAHDIIVHERGQPERIDVSQEDFSYWSAAHDEDFPGNHFNFIAATMYVLRDRRDEVSCLSSEYKQLPAEDYRALAGPYLPDRINRFLERMGSDVRLPGTQPLGIAAIEKRNARLAGFFNMSRENGCDDVARSLLGWLRNIPSTDDWELLSRGEGNCAERLLLALSAPPAPETEASGEGGIVRVERHRGSWFQPVVQIEGDPLPRRLFEPFRAAFMSGETADLTLRGETVSLEAFGLAPAWSAVDPRRDTLVVLFVAAGEARRIEIEGVAGTGAPLEEIVRFAIGSDGVAFRATTRRGGGLVIDVTDAAGDTTLVVFDELNAPTAWVGLRSGERRAGDEGGFAGRRDLLSALLEALAEPERSPFRYRSDGRPEWLTVESDDTALALRPANSAPWFLVAGEAGERRLTLLCASRPLDPPELLTLAVRAAPDFGTDMPDAADLARRLTALGAASAGGDICAAPVLGVARYRPAPTRPDGSSGVPFLVGTGEEGRLLVAPAGACQDDPLCPLKVERTEPAVSDAFAKALLEGLDTMLGAQNVDPAGLALVHDDGPGERTEGRRIIFLASASSRSLALVGVDRGAEPCVSPPLGLRVRSSDDALRPFAALAAVEQEAVKGSLVAYVTRALADAASPLCGRVRSVEAYFVISGEGDARRIDIFEERAEAPTERERRLAGRGADRRLARLVLHPQVIDAPPADVGFVMAGSEGTRPVVVDGLSARFERDSRTVEIITPPGTTDAERGAIYDALLPYLGALTDADPGTFRVERLDEGFYGAPFRGRSVVYMDTVDEPAADHLIPVADDADEAPPVWLLRRVVRLKRDAAEADVERPARLVRRIDGQRGLVALEGPGAVHEVRQDGPAQRLGDIPPLLPLERDLAFKRIARDPQPFLLCLVEGRLWMRVRDPGEEDCETMAAAASALSRLAFLERSEWVEIRTDIAPEAFPFRDLDLVRSALSSGRADGEVILVTQPADNVTAVAVHSEEGCTGERARVAELRTLERETETISEERLRGEERPCIALDDLAPLLPHLADGPEAWLGLVGNPLAEGTGHPALYDPQTPERWLLAMWTKALEVWPDEADGDPHDALRAVVEADPAGVVVSDAPTAAVLPMRRESAGGAEWFVLASHVLVDVGGGGDVARRLMTTPATAFEDRDGRMLLRRLVLRLAAVLEDRPEDWPTEIVAPDGGPFLAAIDGGSRRDWLAAAREKPGAVRVEVVSGAAPDAGKALAETLGVTFGVWPEPVTGVAVTLDPVAAKADVFARGDDTVEAALRIVGGGPVTIALPEGALRVRTDRLPMVSEALDARTGEARLWLAGEGSALRVCGGGSPAFRLVGDADALPSVDFEIYSEGMRLACEETFSRPMLSDSVARLAADVRAGERVGVVAGILARSPPTKGAAGLVGRIQDGTAGPLRIAGRPAATGCTTRLEGDGARLLAHLLLEGPDSVCVLPPLEADAAGGREAFAAIVGPDTQIVVRTDACRRTIARNPAGPATILDGGLLGNFAIALVDEGSCESDGGGIRWLVEGEDPFLSLPERPRRFLAIARNLTVLEADGAAPLEPVDEVRLARVLVSDGILGDSATAPALLSASVESGVLRVRIPSSAPARPPAKPGGLADAGSPVQQAVLGIDENDGPACATPGAGCSGEAEPSVRELLVDERRCIGIVAAGGLGAQRALDLAPEAPPDANRFDCRRILVDLATASDSLAGFVARLDPASDGIMACLSTFPSAAGDRLRCAGPVSFLGRDLDPLTVDFGANPSAAREGLLADLFGLVGGKPGAAALFLEALYDGWELGWVDGRPEYRFVLMKGEAEGQRVRYSTIGRHCLEASVSEIATVLEPLCGSSNSLGASSQRFCGSDDITVSLAIVAKAVRGAAADRKPADFELWPNFSRDPRLALCRASVVCDTEGSAPC